VRLAQCVTERCPTCDWHPLGSTFSSSTGPKSHIRSFEGPFPGILVTVQSGLDLPNLVSANEFVPFLRSLRRITEVIFDLLLCAYISSIKAFRFQIQRPGESYKFDNLKWEDALKSAAKALRLFRDAESKRQIRDDRVDEFALEAQKILGQRYLRTFLSLHYISLIF
jgi:hypothetical protein